MRSPSKLLALSLFLFAAPLFAQTPAQTPAQTAAQTPAPIPSGRVVLVLPFENRSGDASLGWIGDSFPDTLNKRLNSAGFLTISRDDRSFAYDHLGLPVAFRPSRATTIRIAQQLDANFVVIGSYTVPLVPAGTASVQHIDIKAQVLSIDDLRLSPPVEDGAELSRLFDAENAIAWKIARVMDPHFNVAEPTFLAAPGAVPLPAFEDYIRGTNTPATAERIKRLQAAVALAPGYAAALLALGKAQYAARSFDAAAATLGKVPASDRLALEANFYLGLARFNTANYDAAARAFEFVATRLPLPEVVNDQAVALSRQGKDAIALFQRASLADPSDEDYHYNLAIAFFRGGDTAHALEQADEALKLKPADNEAIDLRKQLAAVAPGTRLTATAAAPLTQTSVYIPVERIRRNYSETGFRQAAFQLDQLRAARLSLLPPAQRAAEYLQQGRDYFGQGLLPEAETEFQSALEAEPNSAAAHAGLAEVRVASGDLEQARSEAKLSLQLHPSAAAWLVMARIEMSANQLSECATDVSHALQLEPTNATAISLRQYLAQRGQLLP